MKAEERLDDVPAQLWITDGRVHMEANEDAAVYLQTPDQQPLTVREPEFTLFVKGNDFEATVTLDSEQADVLRAVLAGGGETA